MAMPKWDKSEKEMEDAGVTPVTKSCPPRCRTWFYAHGGELDRVYVPNDPEIRKLILQEAHDSLYSIHPGNTKMYLDLKDTFWWTGMKKDIVEYVAVCDVCQRVKAEHQKPAGLLHPLPIPEWK